MFCAACSLVFFFTFCRWLFLLFIRSCTLLSAQYRVAFNLFEQIYPDRPALFLHPCWVTPPSPLNLHLSYLVEYTPVVAGKYFPVVTLDGQEISTDMGGGVIVSPANASAVWSTFESDLVGVHFKFIAVRKMCQRFDALVAAHLTLRRVTHTHIPRQMMCAANRAGLLLKCPTNATPCSADQCPTPPYINTQVAFQGLAHTHTLEIRDRFENLLDSYPTDGGFATTLVGTPDARAGVLQTAEGQDSDPSGTVATTVTVSNVTDASGKLAATFTPEVAGTYVMSNEYTGPGGLLATFYRTQDFTDSVLENSAHTTEVRAHFVFNTSPTRGTPY